MSNGWHAGCLDPELYDGMQRGRDCDQRDALLTLLPHDSQTFSDQVLL